MIAPERPGSRNGRPPRLRLIVDDERLARSKLRRFLDEQPDVEIVGECASGAEAVERIRAEQPDLLFLDIQMPGLDGFAVLREVGPERRGRVVFVTVAALLERIENPRQGRLPWTASSSAPQGG